MTLRTPTLALDSMNYGPRGDGLIDVVPNEARNSFTY